MDRQSPSLIVVKDPVNFEYDRVWYRGNDRQRILRVCSVGVTSGIVLWTKPRLLLKPVGEDRFAESRLVMKRGN